MTLTKLHEMDERQAQILDDVLEAFELLKPRGRRHAKSDVLVSTYVVQGYYRRAPRKLRLVGGTRRKVA